MKRVWTSSFSALYAVCASLSAGQADWAYKAAEGPNPVRAAEVVLHDSKRGKDVQLRVTWPDADGSFPVLVWSHGATGTKDMYQPLVRHWASHGYVCLQADHSDSRALTGRSGAGPATFADWESRPKDVVFILDALDEIEAKVPALKGKMNRQAIGVGGHSFGAHTAQLVAGATTVGPDGQRRSHADGRPRAFVLLSPQGIGPQSGGLDEKSWGGVTRPFIVITGTKDIGRTGDDWRWRLDPWKYAPRKDKFLLVIEGAWHGFGGIAGDAAFRGAGPENPAHVLYVKSASTAFWDAFLKGDSQAAAFLRSGTMTEKSRGEARLSYGEDTPAQGSEVGSVRGMYEAIFVDALWHDSNRDRDVPVRIFAPKEAEGRLPVLIFSHGGGESRDAYTYLGEHLARRGYLVVFMTHKGSDRDIVEKEGLRGLAGLDDSRPADVRFVLDRLLSEDPGSTLLKGRVDSGALAVGGHCAGATTAITLVGGTIHLLGQNGVSFTDPRVRVCVLLGPQPAAGEVMARVLHQASWSTVKVPTLVVTGTDDFNWIPAVRTNPKMLRMAYDGLPPGDNYLVEIASAEHNAFTDSVPYYPARRRDPRHHGWICRAVADFLDAHLRGDRVARSRLLDKELERQTNGECRQESKAGKPPEETGSRLIGLGATEFRPLGAADARVQVERMFRIFDRDRDGALAKEEAPERLQRGFEVIDADRNGKISMAEMTKALERVRPPPGDHGGKVFPGEGLGLADAVVLRDARRNADLRVRVIWPEKDGPFPVIVFSHCVNGARSDYRPLVEHWAKHGYVVIQPDHSDSRERGGGGSGLDWAGRARDLSFVIDSLVEIEKKVPVIRGKMDAGRVGAGGHLIGAYAACTLAGQKNFNSGAPRDLNDDRVKAVLLLSPQGCGQGLTQDSWKEVRIPLMVVSGSKIPSLRTGNPAEWRKEPFAFSPPGGKHLVWIEGLDGKYAGLINGEGADEKMADWIKRATLAFWDAYLKGDVVQKEYLQSAAMQGESGGKVTITSKPEK